MDISEALRRAYITAIGTLTVNGTVIPVFDEFVNPNVTIPQINAESVLNISAIVNGEEKLLTNEKGFQIVQGTGEFPANVASPYVYVVIQDQQETEGVQNFCNYRQNCNITLRVVTIFNSAGVVGKRYAEAVSDAIQRLIKPTGKTHALVNANGYSFQRVEKELSRTYTENANSKTAINKVIIYNNVVNQ